MNDKPQKTKHIKRRKVKVLPVQEYDRFEIKRIRESLNLSPMVFAEAIGVSHKTVEGWEYGYNSPKGSSKRLLQILDKNKNILDENNILRDKV